MSPPGESQEVGPGSLEFFHQQKSLRLSYQKRPLKKRVVSLLIVFIQLCSVRSFSFFLVVVEVGEGGFGLVYHHAIGVGWFLF
jgi:sRNA-binding regulator protein Hfq